MIRLAITLLYLFSCTTAIAQSEVEYHKVAAKKEKMLTSLAKNPIDVYPGAHSYVSMSIALMYGLLGAEDSTLYYLNHALDVCDSNPLDAECKEIFDPNILGFYHLKNCTKSPEWKKFENRITTHYKNTYNPSNLPLAIRILKAGGADQSVRYYHLLMQTDAAKAIVRETDSLNLVFIKRHIGQHGFPGISEVGEPASNAAFLLVQHADNDIEFQKQVLSHMEKLLVAKDITPSHYAYLYDRVMVKEQGKQYYGTQFKNMSKSELFPIEDNLHVDQRRIKLGLSTLADYLKSTGIF